MEEINKTGEDSDNVMTSLLSNLRKGNMQSVRKSVKLSDRNNEFKFSLASDPEKLNNFKANLRPNIRNNPSNALNFQFTRET